MSVRVRRYSDPGQAWFSVPRGTVCDLAARHGDALFASLAIHGGEPSRIGGEHVYLEETRAWPLFVELAQRYGFDYEVAPLECVPKCVVRQLPLYHPALARFGLAGTGVELADGRRGVIWLEHEPQPGRPALVVNTDDGGWYGVDLARFSDFLVVSSIPDRSFEPGGPDPEPTEELDDEPEPPQPTM